MNTITTAARVIVKVKHICMRLWLKQIWLLKMLVGSLLNFLCQLIKLIYQNYLIKL